MTLLNNLARLVGLNNGNPAYREAIITSGWSNDYLVYDCKFYEARGAQPKTLVGHFFAATHHGADVLAWKFEERGIKAARKWAEGRNDIVDADPFITILPRLRNISDALCLLAFVSAGLLLGSVIVEAIQWAVR